MPCLFKQHNNLIKLTWKTQGKYYTYPWGPEESKIVLFSKEILIIHNWNQLLGTPYFGERHWSKWEQSQTNPKLACSKSSKTCPPVSWIDKIYFNILTKSCRIYIYSHAPHTQGVQLKFPPMDINTPIYIW